MRILSIRALAILAILALGLPTLSGCAMSRSSSRSFASMASIWSLSASFRSSFGGPGRAGLDEEYAFDVASVGAAAASSDAPAAFLRDDVTRVATSHGVTDWEVLEETWIGLGIGLRHVGLSEAETQALVSEAFGTEPAARTIAATYVD